MVPIEAMASGTPVIGPNSGGLRETIKHNYNGILLDELTADHMAKAIDDLLDTPDKYEYLRKNTRISAEKFSWEEHVKKLEKVLDELIHSYKGSFSTL
jgi:glycosyltransferase involved in cell wall biosynthesis